MAIVTFMSDFGTEDHYVAAVKARLLGINPNLSIVDITHQLPTSDVGQAAYTLKQIFRDFPPGTVHLCGIENHTDTATKLVAIKLEEYYFVGENNGLFSLVSDQKPTAVVALNELNPIQSTFHAKDILAPTAAALASGQNIHEMGPNLEQMHTLLGRQLKVTKREISGNVVRVDHYGNLITNIDKQSFDTIRKLNGEKAFEVCFGRERTARIHQKYGEVESGEYFVIFNSNGYLQIGINKGKASELMGIHHDAPIIINFQL